MGQNYNSKLLKQEEKLKMTKKLQQRKTNKKENWS